MSGITQVTKTGPKTFTAGELVLGGQVVEGTDTGVVIPATADSERVVGVALTDAQPAPADNPVTDAAGRPVVVAVQLPTTVAVAYSGIEVRVTYSAAAKFGARLVATADGTVGPAAADAAAATIVGVCTEPAGVAADARGLIRLA